jgi:hypothetical protein
MVLCRALCVSLTSAGLALVEVAPGIDLAGHPGLLDFANRADPAGDRLFRAAMGLEAMLLDRPLADQFTLDPARSMLFIGCNYRVRA